MTTAQDPIAHAARLLRETAEELRQAHAYHRSEGWQGETGAQSAYDVYMAAAQALEDWEQAIGAGGVQARSAAPAEQQAAPKAAPTRTALPEGWTDCTIEFGNDGPEVVAYGPKRMMTRLAKWLGKYFAQVIAEAAPKAAPGEPSDADIDAFLDSPGGIEWVIADKRERYRLLVRAVLAKWAAPQQEAQEPTEIPEEIERMAADRYKVVPSHESMFHRWAVVAGTGTQQLYLGREVECQNMARKFAGAFLDGAFVAMQRTAPQPAPAPLSEPIDQLERALAIIGVVGAIDGHDVVRRESVLEIARRAALAAQGGE